MSGSQATKTAQDDYDLPAAVAKLHLIYVGGIGLGDSKTRVLANGITTIGRGVTVAGIDLEMDERASRKHASFHVSNQDAQHAEPVVQIVDGKSKNGTFVNGHRISSCLLADGDVVRLGDTVLLFRVERGEDLDEAVVPTLVGRSPGIKALRNHIAQVALTELPVLLLGESGTGKELAARAVHQLSQAASRGGSFVARNCAAIPETLAESELFGHVQGAFSGARTKHEGLFSAAHRGTLFLDEIGEMVPALQAKLLRVLEDGQVIPVGSSQPTKVEVRLIAATNRDLPIEVLAGRFRRDLYERISTLLIELPPLRLRREDIPLLLDHHWHGPLPRLTARLVEAMMLYRWPGNVRELIKLVHTLQAQPQRLRVLDLPLVAANLRLTPAVAKTPSVTQPAEESEDSAIVIPLPDAQTEPPIDRETLLRLMEENQGVINRVAKAVNRSRRQVSRWLSQYKINPQRRR